MNKEAQDYIVTVQVLVKAQTKDDAKNLAQFYMSNVRAPIKIVNAVKE